MQALKKLASKLPGGQQAKKPRGSNANNNKFYFCSCYSYYFYFCLCYFYD